MANKNLASLSVDALFKLRDDVTAVLSSRAGELQSQLAKLTGTAPTKRAYTKRKAKKISAKYKGPNGETWAGRGTKPRWLTAELKKGKKIESFAIGAGQPAKR